VKQSKIAHLICLLPLDSLYSPILNVAKFNNLLKLNGILFVYRSMLQCQNSIKLESTSNSGTQPEHHPQMKQEVLLKIDVLGVQISLVMQYASVPWVLRNIRSLEDLTWSCPYRHRNLFPLFRPKLQQSRWPTKLRKAKSVVEILTTQGAGNLIFRAIRAKMRQAIEIGDPGNNGY
jgi:hypothetical protein